MFKSVSNQQHFPKLEEEILKFWEKENIFKKSLENRKGSEEFIFYDGPPFATGLPHYGHLLAGIIKDIIPRYQTMRGKYVDRRFGWDCHGLPVEMEMQNELDLKSSQDIIDYGVAKFNEACRNIVLRYTDEWEKTVKRLGRWVDFENDYKTMDLSFMESIWWVFKTIYDQGLIYESFKVLPYSWKAGTSLSNFEANLNYKDVQDPALTVKFPLRDEKDTYFLAWTTTPWTLISNLALCVNEEVEYVKVKSKKNNEFYILAKGRVNHCFDLETDGEVLTTVKGSELIGKKYSSLFSYADKSIDTSNSYQILADDFVTDSDGTGIVHLAPAYGEDDYRVCQKNGLTIYDPVDENGSFKSEVDFIAGKNIKEADKDIIRHLKEKNLIFKHDTLEHSYPFCWRTDTPLIYKAVSTWFVKVENLKENMMENNQSIHWVPAHIKKGRFGKWLESARDWDIGRNRFWGTPLPIWKSEEGDVLCFGDIKSLEKMSGESITDLHKHFIDKITITHEGKTYRRIEQVLDCWFESGSMPYAQNHYPFENKELFEKNFPANFIAEGLDQTRGWFYTLLVISSAIMKKPPFENVIVNGLILAEDGKKMSKRLKNYPDPQHILNEYGADALRLYMISSGAVCGEFLKFSKDGVREVLKSIILPLWNSFSFFITYANIDHYQYRPITEVLKNPLDRWILSYIEGLNEEISKSMDDYDLRKSVPPINLFIDKLTNWYIRRSRRRFWKSENDNDKEQAYFTLYTVLLKLSKLIAPFTPFISEKIYLVLAQSQQKESVHLEDYPLPDKSIRDRDLEEEMNWVERVVVLGRSLRSQQKLKVRQPLSEMIIITKNKEKTAYLKKNKKVILDELNIKDISFNQDESQFLSLSAQANFKTLGKKMGAKMKTAASLISQFDVDKIKEIETKGNLSIKIDKEQILLSKEDVLIKRTQKDGLVASNDEDVTVALDTKLSPALIEEGLARDFINRIQKERKERDFHYTDRILVECIASGELKQAIQNFQELIQKEILATDIVFVENLASSITLGFDDKTCQINIKKVN